MTGGVWQKEYQNLLQRSLSSGAPTVDVPGAERRENPRFKLNSGYVWVRVEPRFTVVDVSISGIAFNSNLSFPIGQTIQLVLDGAFLVESRVVSCQMVEADSALLEVQYNVRCEFLNREHGMQLLVMIKEMETASTTPA
jgi:hypothetical protein